MKPKGKKEGDWKKFFEQISDSNTLFHFGTREKEILVEDLPTLDREICSSLPETLKNYLDTIHNDKVRATVLFGLLSFSSGVFPNVVGFYSEDYIESNLFLFLLGASGSGKGKLVLPKKVFNKIHFEKLNEFKRLFADYKRIMEELEDGEQPPEPPKQQLLFIPANNSKTGLIELLEQSDGRGIFYESESDTLSDAIKKEHGNFTDIIRKVFHHESISYYRRGGKERVELERPYLSILLAGTYDQLKGIFYNTQNGLFNRFAFYCLQNEENFVNVFDKEQNKPFELATTILSDTIADVYKELQNKSKELIFELTQEQEKHFNDYFGFEKKRVARAIKSDEANIVHRWAIITYKIMMILSVYEKIDDVTSREKLICSDEVFRSAFKIFSVLREHFVYVYQQLLIQKNQFIKYDREIVGEILRLQAKGTTLRDISKMLNLPLATVYRWSKK